MIGKSGLTLVFVLAFVLAACGAPQPTAQPMAPSATATSEATPSVAGVTEATVIVADLAFQPHTVVVATGATVTWQNDDPVAHTVTSLDKSTFENVVEGGGVTTPTGIFNTSRRHETLGH
jgi:plastocyanin